MESPNLYYTLLVTVFCLVPCAAQNLTQSPQSSKDVPVGWQDNPSRRGTLAIIENCIVTILACTWSIQHLNIPSSNDKSRAKILRKCKWAMLTVFFPEFLMAHAVFEFVLAWNSMAFMEIPGVHVKYPWWRHCREQKKFDEFKWTLTHSYYANMGGFLLDIKEHYPKTPTPFQLFKCWRFWRCWGCVRKPQLSEKDIEEHHPKTLTAFQLSKLWGSIRKPQLSEEDIKDRSKGSFFTKAVALFQISSLLLSILVRVRRGLAFSQLELVTLAFVICGILTYVCRWYKPQDVETATTVTPDKEFDQGQIKNLGIRQYDQFWHAVRHVDGNTKKLYPWRVPNDNLPLMIRQNIQNNIVGVFLDQHPVLYALTVITIIFGSIHLIAWDFEFPTDIEKIWWRIATLTSIGLPPVALLVIPVFAALHKRLVAVNPYRFLESCVAAIREFAWEPSEFRRAQDLYQRLEGFYDNPRPIEQNYKDIFKWDENEDLLKRLGEFINKQNSQLPLEFPAEFPRQYDDLCKKMGDDRYPEGVTRWDTYPPLRLEWPSTILSMTGIVYCVARLSIIVLAFSSLRSMPDSVYTTTWARFIPAIQ